MKHRKFLTGKELDSTKIPPRYIYFKYRDLTKHESDRAERKLRRNNLKRYKQLLSTVENLRSNRKFSLAVKKAMR